MPTRRSKGIGSRAHDDERSWLRGPVIVAAGLVLALLPAPVIADLHGG